MENPQIHAERDFSRIPGFQSFSYEDFLHESDHLETILSEVTGEEVNARGGVVMQTPHWEHIVADDLEMYGSFYSSGSTPVSASKTYEWENGTAEFFYDRNGLFKKDSIVFAMESSESRDASAEILYRLSERDYTHL